MPKYKEVNEGIVDNFISALFTRVGKGLESRTISKLKKKDPELAKKMQKIQDARKDLEKEFKDLEDYLKKNKGKGIKIEQKY